jgi:hypothetical protein
MGAGAIGHHVKTGVQPQVDLDANAIVSVVGVPAQGKQMLLGAGKKLLLAEGDMVFAGVERAGNVAMRHQQLRVLALAQAASRLSLPEPEAPPARSVFPFRRPSFPDARRGRYGHVRRDGAPAPGRRVYLRR